MYRAYGIRESSPEFSETSRSLRRVLMFAHEPNKEKLLKERSQIKLKYIVYASSSTFIYRFHTNQTSSVQNKHFSYVLHHLQVGQMSMLLEAKQHRFKLLRQIEMEGLWSNTMQS